MRLERLFTPARIGTLELRNRIVLAPMTTTFAGEDGLPSPRLGAYLEARARGGAGLLTLEAATVDPRHREVPRCLHFGDDTVIPQHRALVERLHLHGARVQPQLVHPGPDSLSPRLDGTPSVGPSVIPSYLTGHPCRELDAAGIEEIVQRFGEAARRVREAGYDGLELHAAHGYMLLGSFLSPLRNRRSDAYGVRGPGGGTRIVLEVLRAMRARIGADFPVTLRISGSERRPGGRSLADTQRLAPLLAAAGVDAFHVSGGSIDRYVSEIVTGSHWPDAHNAAAAAALRRVVDRPVLVVGRIHDPRVAERVLRRGQADLVVMGRALLADPELPAKARAGRLADVRPCISCQHCIDSLERLDLRCAVNARTGREAEHGLAPARVRRRVVVAGAGCAGLEAARLLALRGHEVVLVERERRLGGSLFWAAVAHAANEPFLRFLVRQVRRLPIELRLGEECTPEGAVRLRAEVAVVATGARVTVPQIPGDHLPHVWTGPGLRGLFATGPGRRDLRRLPVLLRPAARVLRGRVGASLAPGRVRALVRRALPFGPRVAVVGGDLAALELAEWLAGTDREVMLLAEGDELAPEVGGKRRAEHVERLDRLGVSVHTGIEVCEITPAGCRVRLPGGAARPVAVEAVVLAGTPQPDPSLREALSAVVPEVQATGDCNGLGLIAGATRDALRVASQI